MDYKNDNPPKTIAEVGIYLGVIGNDISEIKNSLKDTPSQREVDSISERVTVLEMMISSIKNRIVIWAITILVTMVLAQYGLNTYL